MSETFVIRLTGKPDRVSAALRDPIWRQMVAGTHCVGCRCRAGFLWRLIHGGNISYEYVFRSPGEVFDLPVELDAR